MMALALTHAYRPIFVERPNHLVSASLFVTIATPPASSMFDARKRDVDD